MIASCATLTIDRIIWYIIFMLCVAVPVMYSLNRSHLDYNRQNNRLFSLCWLQFSLYFQKICCCKTVTITQVHNWVGLIQTNCDKLTLRHPQKGIRTNDSIICLGSSTSNNIMFKRITSYSNQ